MDMKRLPSPINQRQKRPIDLLLIKPHKAPNRNPCVEAPTAMTTGHLCQYLCYPLLGFSPSVRSPGPSVWRLENAEVQELSAIARMGEGELQRGILRVGIGLNGLDEVLQTVA